MFKMQTDNYNFRKNIATNKKSVLRKMSLKSQNSKSNILSKIVYYVFFVISWNSLELRDQ